ncbi:hypothetical protein PVK64_19730 [Aliivibrio sp. S4TY2]|uniref:hypothetical protein n=1 Tax=unclassified Aliivibrio TaxID=2645654 RepID=UPI002378BAAC|nr:MULTISPECIES: hypothetical protein [unclassified Aliivibrio]MDD9158399.1 hypothetical protein [Aliivibrio sp. S4TY2]MDD9162399.1 hypothetical protein [Aliivibrio sp. S4TY1]MDD9166406.1 hypothetical protein [Aliivibrio sp. S4MY2]MDD9170404.1 hypothetical protein [Aliivibrio sp. S4MY4]MDD9187486.1 hypothetical protein [Aliivibrio sp. S4MY3]
MDIVLSTYKDPAYGLDWHEQTDEIENSLRELIIQSKLPVEFSIRESNIGRGADCPVTIFQVISVFGFIAFAIPEAHKRVRESIEEWSLIKENALKLIALLTKNNRMVALPDEILFIKSVEALLSEIEANDAMFIKYEVIHSVDSFEKFAGLKGFYFECLDKQWRVVIDGQGKVKLIEQV